MEIVAEKERWLKGGANTVQGRGTSANERSLLRIPARVEVVRRERGTERREFFRRARRNGGDHGPQRRGEIGVAEAAARIPGAGRGPHHPGRSGRDGLDGGAVFRNPAARDDGFSGRRAIRFADGVAYKRADRPAEANAAEDFDCGNARYAFGEEARGSRDFSGRGTRGVFRNLAGVGRDARSVPEKFSGARRDGSRSGCHGVSESKAGDAKKQLLRVMGFWDVLLFNIATVLGPRWIAAAAHNGTSSISLWVLAAALFFLPSTLIIAELSTRFPHEGGLYVWSKEAFGEFHGFVAGWTYWIYTFFYFPGLLMASAAMAAYLGGSHGAYLADDRTFLMVVSFALLVAAVVLNIIGLNIGKWLQNAGGVGTYVLMLIGLGVYFWLKHGSVTHFTWDNMLPTWNWGTVNFWPQIAFAFTGLELC